MQVKFHPEVKEDLAETARYYEAAERGLGHGFIEDYRETLALVVRDATVYRKIHKLPLAELVFLVPQGGLVKTG